MRSIGRGGGGGGFQLLYILMKRVFFSQSWVDLKEGLVVSGFLSIFESCFWLPICFLHLFCLFLEREELLQSQLLEGASRCRGSLQVQDEVLL